nr:hypothetical protein [uncultured Sphingomonas sp.]
MSDVPRTPEGLPFIEENTTPLDMVFDADGYPIILFEPVPMLRRRKHGAEAAKVPAMRSIVGKQPEGGCAAAAGVYCHVVPHAVRLPRRARGGEATRAAMLGA